MFEVLVSISLIAEFSLIKCAPINGNEDFSLLIMHTNDMHSRLAEQDIYSNPCDDEKSKKGQCFGGFARLKTAVNQGRWEAQRDDIGSLFLNAGDTFQGTVFYTLEKWKIIAQFIGLLGIDAMSLGNHEFDDGIAGLAPYLQNITIPVVAANLDVSLVPELQLPILTPYKILQVKGKSIGVIGYLTPETKFLSNPEKVIFMDEIESISAVAKKLKSDGVDIIIALGHSGYEVDLKIAEKVPDVSLVIGGHTNTFLYTPKDSPPSTEAAVSDYPNVVTQANGRKVPVIQAYSFTKYLGKLRITFDSKGNAVSWSGNPLLLDSSIGQDENILRQLEEISPTIDQKVKQVISQTNVFLEGEETKCRIRECNLGNFIADAFIDYVAGRNHKNTSWTNSSMAIIQGGSIRINIPEGNITMEQLLTVLPFQNELMIATISGKTLRSAIEYSVHRYRVLQSDGFAGWGEFLQFSGIRVVYDMSNPVNERAVSIKVRCSNCIVPVYSPLVDDQDYPVVMSSYLSNGGDGFTMLKDERKKIEEIGYTDTESVAVYLKKLKYIYPQDEDRIILKNLPSPSISSDVSTNFKISSLNLILWASLLYILS